jgi:peptidoglycan/xylan/chitin deacetylase (PgdA/CDA1 family)
MAKYIRVVTGLVLALLIVLMMDLPALAYKIYRVRPGDNLQKIAIWHGVTTKSLITINQLANPKRIVPGEVLLIPEPFTKKDERLYIVKPGDTLGSIAKKFEVSLDWLLDRNPLWDSSKIYAGQMIRIKAPPPDPVKPGISKPKNSYVYNIPDLKAHHPGYVFLKGSTLGKRVALTFDDGPDNRFTPQILDKLGELGVKATFFLEGKRIPGNEWVVTRMIWEGHIVGNHSYSHPNLRKLSIAKIKGEITRTNQLIQSTIHYSPKLVRPPYGEMSEAGLDWMAANGYRMVNWSVDSGDWRANRPDQILERILPEIQPGSIILFHCAGGTGENLTPTVEVLHDFVSTLQSRGYTIVPLTELIGAKAY